MLTPFSPLPGLNSDDTTFAAEGRWADGINVRFHNGKPQVKGGEAELFSFNLLSTQCRAILPFRRSGSISIAYGLDGSSPSLYVGSALSVPSDRTPVGLSATANWSLAPWGDTLLAVPEGGTLYEQSALSTATEVAQAPNSITYMLVTAQRQVLALGCSEEASGTFNSLCIRGCDLEDYTDWTTSATNNVFEHILDSGGAIVAGRAIGPYVAVWTTSSLFLGQFIGDPGQTYFFDKVSENCGLVGPNAVVVHNQAAYWMGPDLRLRRWTVGALPEILPCPISRAIIGNIALHNADEITVSVNSRFNEIRIDYEATTGIKFPAGAQNNQYIAICLDDGSWHRGNGGRSAMVDSVLLSSLTTSFTHGPTIISASGSGSITVRLHETGAFDWSGGTHMFQAPFIKSAGFYIDNSQRRVMIRGVIPDFEDQSGDVLLTLTVRDHPQSSETTKGPYTLTTATSKKDFRTSGKIVTAKFGADNTNGGTNFYFRLGKPLFDIVPMGER